MNCNDAILRSAQRTQAKINSRESIMKMDQSRMRTEAFEHATNLVLEYLVSFRHQSVTKHKIWQWLCDHLDTKLSVEKEDKLTINRKTKFFIYYKELDHILETLVENNFIGESVCVPHGSDKKETFFRYYK